ncbi:amino acid adenylation domain-containing protein [Actinosynnema sp. NPDC023587]|uniref:amino acid adenylation domain-containing protein n=1 Tax=Actinosynnema sp. NPDC023587 TaxID=3154695 RepID=UPI003409C869
MTTLLDREYWLARREDALAAVAATADALGAHPGRPRPHDRALPAATARRLSAITGEDPALTWTAVSAATALVLSRFGAGDRVLLRHGDVPVLLDLPAGGTFREWLGAVRAALAEALARGPAADPVDPPVDLTLAAGRLTATTTAPEPVAHAVLDGVVAVLDGGLRDPGVSPADLAAVDDATRRRVLVEFNDHRPPAVGRSFRDLLLTQARLRPDAVAIRDADTAIGYGELVRYVVAVGGRLRAAGVGPGDLVALHAPRDAWYVAAGAAVLATGAAYLPLDPELPAARTAGMLAEARAVLTAGPLAADIDDAAADIAVIDLAALDPTGLDPTGLDPTGLDPVGAPVSRAEAERLLGPEAEPGDLAYVIFTSGSTGRPKGACIEHRNLLNLMAFRVGDCGLRPGVELPQTAPVTFDISVWQMFTALTAGACTYVVGADVAADPAALARLIAERGFEVVELVPSLISVLVEILADDPELADGVRTALRAMISTGEVLPAELARRWCALLPSVPLYNAYGPAECTDDITQGVVTGADAGTFAPVGTPLPNAAVYVLDRDMQPLPPLVVGEIYAGGPNVGRGYLRRPGLTAAAFVPDPFRAVPGTRMYRTGDRGRWRPDGVLEVLGRADDQVKVRGRRVELGEIESVLAARPDVARCAVELVRDGGVERLAGFAVPAPDHVLDVDALTAHLAARLPGWMVPSEIHVLDALPVTPNGKVDRKALRTTPAARPREHTPPRTDVERALCEVWAEHLRVDRVGVHDDFFALGGDSIVGIRISHQANRRGIGVRPRHLLEHPTVAALARVVSERTAEAEPEPEGGDAPLTPVQRWFFAQDFTDPHHWNQSHVLVSAEPLDFDAARRALRAVVHRHEQLRVRFRDGRQVVGPVPDDLLWRAAPDDLTTIDRAHAALSLVTGPLIRAVLVGTDRLLVTAHHLVVDQVSWLILVEDLEIAYRAALRGVPPAFPDRTEPFVRWARASAGLPTPVPPELPAGSRPIAVDESVPNHYGRRAVAEVVLTAELSRRVLRQTTPAVLLAALGRVLDGPGHVVVEVEGHGRDEADGVLDVQRTVGWFTVFGPVALPVRADVTTDEVADLLADARPHIAAHLRTGRPVTADLGFNYLGRVDGAASGDALFTLGADLGRRRADAGHRTVEWEVDAGVADDRLVITVEHVPGRHDPAQVAAVLHAWRDAIAALPGERLADRAPLTPAQVSFFDRDLAEPDHWNHGVRYALARPLSRADAERVARALLDRHPVLGAVFPGRRQALPRDPRLPVHEYLGSVEAHADEGHRGLDLARGPVARLHLHHAPTGDELLFVVHHLVVDAPSWDVLTDDLSALLAGAEPAPPTSSYLAWSRALHRLVRDHPERLDQAAWLAFDHSTARQLVADDRTGRDDAVVEVTHRFTPEWTAGFLRAPAAAARLLTHLGRAAERWSPDDRDLLVELGGHGREDLFDELDVSRTVGWFTTSFPFVLRHSRGRGFAEHAAETEALLRAVPGRGFGFEALRALGGAETRSALGGVPNPVLRFDHHGEMSFLDTGSAVTAVGTGGTGRWKPADAPLPHLVAVNSSVHGGALEVRVQCAGDVLPRARIDALVAAIIDELDPEQTGTDTAKAGNA